MDIIHNIIAHGAVDGVQLYINTITTEILNYEATTLTNTTIVMIMMMFVLMTTLICSLYILWAYEKSSSRDPKTWPILGAQLEIRRNYEHLLDWITSFFTDDHRTVRIRLLARTSFLTVDPANVQHILKSNFSNYPKVNILWSILNE